MHNNLAGGVKGPMRNQSVLYRRKRSVYAQRNAVKFVTIAALRILSDDINITSTMRAVEYITRRKYIYIYIYI